MTRTKHTTVFRDVGFSPREAEALRIRADLMIALTALIERRRLTQAAAATLMNVSQPRISDLKRGKIDRFSIDMLIRMLSRAGVRVAVTVRPSGRRHSAQAA
jgi:predicted XRE-type DNA-binding protein